MRKVVIGLLGTTIDDGFGARRWERWRPSIDIHQHEDFQIDRFELLAGQAHAKLAAQIAADVKNVSPDTLVRQHALAMKNPWDFAEVYEVLADFAEAYEWRPEREEYFVHITTGTHVAQICLFLLCETCAIPAKLLQASPPRQGAVGSFQVIDLDLSQYDRLAARFAAGRKNAQSILKAGIDTQNAAFNTLIEEIEHVATSTKDPLLLTGATGTGKSDLCRRIYELKKQRHQVDGPLVAVNCATLRGDSAMSALFGHTKGAFTGASDMRTGFLKRAHGGVLFLDEIGELGLDEQAMLLKALEEKTFYPVGADKEVTSQFQLIAGTNRDLRTSTFRDDLLARIGMWSFRLPSLHERAEDIEPNLDFELRRLTCDLGTHVSMSRTARTKFLDYATSAPWPGNFRDFNAALRRMATLAKGGRISDDDVRVEVGRGQKAPVGSHPATRGLDRFDRVQLDDVISVCKSAPTLSAAGRVLFEKSLKQKKSSNDADRLRKYLARFDLSFEALR